MCSELKFVFSVLKNIFLTFYQKYIKIEILIYFRCAGKNKSQLLSYLTDLNNFDCIYICEIRIIFYLW